MNRIEQTDPTFTIIPILANGAGAKNVYPTNGQEKRLRVGHTLHKRNGHWEGPNLVLESTIRFHGRSHTTSEVVSLSPDGKTLTMAFHAFRENHRDDYKVVSERVAE
jgi:hypothetical protein